MPRLSLLAALALTALLAFAASAPAEEGDGLETPVSTGSELEVEECEVNEADECVVTEEGAEVPEECLLSSAEATVFASGNSDKVRLQLRYTATTPTAVAVAYGLHGSKGSLYLGEEKKRFGKKGVLRLNRGLTEAQMSRVMAAKDFAVRIRILEAPGYCQDYFDRQLTVRRATPSGLTWLQAE